MLQTKPMINESKMPQNPSFKVVQAASRYSGRLSMINCRFKFIDQHLKHYSDAIKKLLPLFRGRSFFRGSTLVTGYKIRHLNTPVHIYLNTITGVPAGVYSFSIRYSRMHFS
jgi:hypothetical protein